MSSRTISKTTSTTPRTTRCHTHRKTLLMPDAMSTFVVVRKEGLYNPSCNLLFRRQKLLQQRLPTQPVSPLPLLQQSPIFLEFESRAG